MILSTPAVTALLRATDKAVPEMGDAEVSVTQGLFLSHDPLLPLDLAPVSVAAIQNGSVLLNDVRDIGPLNGAASQGLVNLGPGLWTIQIDSWGYANFAAANGVIYTVIYQGQTFYLGGIGFFSESFSQQIKHRFLLRGSMSINKAWVATAAGQNINIGTVLHCTRHL